MTQRRTIRRLVSILGAASALIATGTAVAAPGECPALMPLGNVTDGMTGEGWTVSQGVTPEPFDGEVLGILPDAIAPGRDMIIVDATSPAIDQAGGIWAGMSGPPFYVNGKLVGVVAFALTFGPSPLAGIP